MILLPNLDLWKSILDGCSLRFFSWLLKKAPHFYLILKWRAQRSMCAWHFPNWGQTVHILNILNIGRFHKFQLFSLGRGFSFIEVIWTTANHPWPKFPLPNRNEENTCQSAVNLQTMPYWKRILSTFLFKWALCFIKKRSVPCTVLLILQTFSGINLSW